MTGHDQPTGIDERLTRLLGGPERASLRRRLRRPFEGGSPDDAEPTRFRLGGLEPQEIRLLASLMGRKVRIDAASIEIDVAAIDDALLRAGLATSLKAALEQLDGPIMRRSAARLAASARWSGVAGSSTDARLASCLATPGGLGLLKRLARQNADAAEVLCGRAARVLAALPATGVARAELAARILGDAHALDACQPVATLVLAALRHGDRITQSGPDDDEPTEADSVEKGRRADETILHPSGEGERDRHVWARAGVLVNELARPALVLNLPLTGGSVWGVGAGEPAYMSLRVLLRNTLRFDVEGKMISVCENPNFMAMVADRIGAASAPLICTDGMPAAAQRTLLLALAAAGAKLRYHGDFDWAGLRIAATVMSICGAAPWQFTTDYYRAAADRFAGAPLAGNPIPCPWDSSLAEAMQRCGLAIAEEATIDDLIADLAT